MRESTTSGRGGAGLAEAWIVLPASPARSTEERPSWSKRILGRSPLERHLLHLARLEIGRCILRLPDGGSGDGLEEECRRQVAGLETGGMRVEIRRAGDPSGPCLVVRGDAVFDPRLYQVVGASSGAVVLVDGGDEAAERPIGLAKLDDDGGPGSKEDGVLRLSGGEPLERALARLAARRVRVGDLPRYLPEMRRRLRPYWRAIRSERDRGEAARRILDAAQKGVLDFPARFLHPAPENLLTRWLADGPVTPNHVTVFTALVAFAATGLFAAGRFGSGLALAIAANVLDGVDGKLARVTMRTSRFGDRLDHVLDVAFEFSWYAAIGWGLARDTGHPAMLWAGVGLIGVMAVSRAVSGLYRALTGRQIHDHRRFDRAFRLVAGRRNVYVLFLVVGWAARALEEAFWVCLAWAVATLLVYVVRFAYAFLARRGDSALWRSDRGATETGA